VLLKLKGELATSSYTFFIVWKNIGPNKFKPVYKSEIKPPERNKQNWAEFKIDTANLCGNDDSQEIKIDFYRHNTSGSHKLLGQDFFELQELVNGKRELKCKGDRVEIEVFEKRRNTNFLEYVFGGCQINLNVAIDFTLSNGDPSDRDSLHSFANPLNDYVRAIRAVGDILQYYDSDKEIPTYGFGASIPPLNNDPCHCFALNGDIFKPECNGIDGVLEAYQRAVRNVNLYGPTNFAEIISSINDRAEAMEVSAHNQQY
jgi:hypothetical protein